MRQSKRNAVALALCLSLSGCARGDESATALTLTKTLAESTPTAESRPWAVPLFSGDDQQTHHAPAKPKPPGPVPEARDLWDRALTCWPVGSLMNAEVSLEGRARNVRGSDFDGTTITQGSRSWVGIVAKIPLWNGAEVERERQREFQRRTKAAEAVGAMLTALTDGERVKRETELVRALERRSQERVRLGVVETSEQVRYLEKVAALESESLKYGASVQRARLDLLALCSAERVEELDQFIRPFIDRRRR